MQHTAQAFQPYLDLVRDSWGDKKSQKDIPIKQTRSLKLQA